MTQYYYLVASLPMLRRDDPPPLYSPAFLELCREQAAAQDHALLARISFDALDILPKDPTVWREYASWETALRDELAVQRGQRLGLDPEPFLRPAPFVVGLAAVAKEALGAGTPREVEDALDRGRWLRLEELEAGTQFDLGRLVVYRLKLLLLERRERFRPEPGRKAFTSEFTRILDGTANQAGRTAAWTNDAASRWGMET